MDQAAGREVLGYSMVGALNLLLGWPRRTILVGRGGGRALGISAISTGTSCARTAGGSATPRNPRSRRRGVQCCPILVVEGKVWREDPRDLSGDPLRRTKVGRYAWMKQRVSAAHRWPGGVTRFFMTGSSFDHLVELRVRRGTTLAEHKRVRTARGLGSEFGSASTVNSWNKLGNTRLGAVHF